MKNKIIAFILCACLICSTCIPAYAVGAEGIIIGGAAAAGITLTLPQVALILAAGYGLIFAVQHADDIASSLDNALTSAAGAIENGIEKLTEWKNNAQKGEIAVSSAPSFVSETVKDWVTSLYEASPVPYDIVANSFVPAGTKVPVAQFWSNSTLSYSKDVTVMRAGSLSTITSYGIEYYSLSSIMYAFSLEPFSTSFKENAKSYYFEGKNYYYYLLSSSTTMPKANLAGDNLITYEAISYLTSLCDINYFYTLYPNSNSLEILLREWLNGTSTPNNSICPDVTVGGIGNALDEHGIDNITLPDINVGQSDLLIPDVEADQSIDDVISDTLTKLKDQELEWTDYINDVTVGTPSVSIPQEDGTVLDFPITDVGVGDVPLDIPSDVTNPLGPYSIDLTQYFPFCIPFDIVRFVNILCAEPEAPSFEWEFTWFDGSKDSLVIDLSPFDTVAQLLRNMEILLFIIGLALITREQIRG